MPESDGIEDLNTDIQSIHTSTPKSAANDFDVQEGLSDSRGGPERQKKSSSDHSSLRSIVEGLAMKQSTSREEARLESTPGGVEVVPACLVPSSKAAHSSDDSADESEAMEASRISPVSTASLPGSPDDGTLSAPDIRRWDTGDMPPAPNLSTRHQTGEVLTAIPERTDYVYEEEEIDKLSRSTEYCSERAKDPGFTLLHYVAMLGHTMLADALSAEMISRHHHFARLARCLISKRRADVLAKDKYGCRPLQLAAACGNTEMVQALLDPYNFDTSGKEVLPQSCHGYDYLNHQDSQICFSALHGAVSHNAFDSVILLLKHGANPQALDVTRKTAFEVAPSLISLQELLRLAVKHEDEVPRSVIVQLMAVVLKEQLKESEANGGKKRATAGAGSSEVAAGAGGGGAGGGASAAAALKDSKVQRSFKAQQRWSKAWRFATSATQAPVVPAQKFTSAIMETLGNMHNADVASTIKRHFGRMYELKRYDVLVEYVVLAINSNQDKLTEIMIDLICNDCPDVLANSKWHETLEPLVSTYPTLFHRLLSKLQDMRDEDVRGFVRCLSPSMLQTSQDHRPQSAPTPMVATSQRGITGKHAVDRVKLLIYQQLVEGLKKVSYRIVKTFFEEADQGLLNDMAQFPIFAEFVSLIASLQTAKAISESDGLRQALLELLRPPKVFAPVYAAAAALPNASAAPGSGGGFASTTRRRESVLGGSPGRPPGAPPVTMAWGCEEMRKVVTRQSSPKVSFALDLQSQTSSLKASLVGPPSCSGSGDVGMSAAGHAHTSVVMRIASSGQLSSPESSALMSMEGVKDIGGRPGGCYGACGGGPVAESSDYRSHSWRPREPLAEEDLGKSRRIRLSLQTLNVQPVLRAAVKAGKAYNVETTVMSIVSWVDTNSKEDKAVFVAGITADLIQELAMRFPSACATLLNLVSRDVLEQLETLQVSANELYGKDHLVKCSHVRNHFTWREQELRKLVSLKKGYSEYVVDALVDYGVPFECIYKAAAEMGRSPEDAATPDQFAALIEHGFTGPELKQLISNGIRLSKVIGYIEECSKPPPDGAGSEFASQLEVPMAELLRDMLRQRLSPRIVDIILREEKMFETTKYNNFRPGRPLRKTFPKKLFEPKYTAHFVQMLLILWQKGEKDAQGNVRMPPWAKGFIDTVFELNDPLSTKLKSAYDNKLTDTQVYIQGGENVAANAFETQSSGGRRDRQQVHKQEAAVEQRTKLHRIRQLLQIFIGNYLFIHRWPVYLAAHLYVFLQNAINTYWQPLEDSHYRRKAMQFGLQMSLAKKSRSGTIDAAVLAFPILGLVQPDGGDILTALVHADAPSAWFNYAIVRALYSLHWSNFGRVMVYLSAAVQLQFAAVFLAFFFLVLNYPPPAAQLPATGGSTTRHRRLNYPPPAAQLPATGIDRDKMWTLPVIQGTLIAAKVLSASMLIERVQEARVPHLGSWVTFGRHLELCYHAMVWVVAGIVWSGRQGDLVPALTGLTMLLFVARLTLFGLITEKLSTAVLALLEIISDSRYFFLLIALVYCGFALAVAGLRNQDDHNATAYTTQLFTVLLGDFQSSTLTSERDVWRFPDFSLVLLSFYAMLMLIVFMNLLIATMNDTYDRVKEFREVEVMRLRSHMMVFVKDFIKHNVGKNLEHLKGDVLHLLLRPEEVKSGRWTAQSASDPSEYSAWAGRITYMRSTIVRELEAVVRTHAERTAEQLGGIEERLDKVEAATAAAAKAAATTTAVPPPPPGVERMAALERRMEDLQHGLEALISRVALPQ